FCLPTCPTYVLWGEEMDSPRGRIQLMETHLDGTATLSSTVVEHFDRCLGCMACVSSCPSGVEYDRLIEVTRATIEHEFRRTRTDGLARSLLFALLPYPGRMRIALRLARLGRFVPLTSSLRPLVELTPPWRSTESAPQRTEPDGPPVGRVGLLTGCVQAAVF